MALLALAAVVAGLWTLPGLIEGLAGTPAVGPPEACVGVLLREGELDRPLTVAGCVSHYISSHRLALTVEGTEPADVVVLHTVVDGTRFETTAVGSPLASAAADTEGSGGCPSFRVEARVLAHPVTYTIRGCNPNGPCLEGV